MVFRSFIAVTVFFQLAVATASAEMTIETYGDSLTAGMLSATSATESPAFADIRIILQNFASYAATKVPDYVLPYQRKDLAWPAQLSELYLKNGIRTTIQNYAISGAKVNDLAGQVSRSARQDRNDTRAFFFIGHNDLCNNPLSLEELTAFFQRAYSKAIEDWDQKHEGATAYLMGIGEIYKLYESLDGHVWYHGDLRELSCSDSWTRLFLYCPSHYRKHRSGILRETLIPKMEAIRGVLEGLANEWSRKNRNHYRFIPSTEGVQFDKSYFAIDCFHLSTRGQKEFAAKVFETISK